MYKRGRWHEDRMRAMRILGGVMAAVRQKGLLWLDQVRYAMVERDGKVSEVPEDG